MPVAGRHVTREAKERNKLSLSLSSYECGVSAVECISSSSDLRSFVMRLALSLAFALLFMDHVGHAFNLCNLPDACNPGDYECCGWNCRELWRTDCTRCKAPPCHCRQGACKSAGKVVPRVGGGMRSAVDEKTEGSKGLKIPNKWPDILLICAFALIIAVTMASAMLWAYLTFRDSKKLQEDETARKARHSGVRTRVPSPTTSHAIREAVKV